MKKRIIILGILSLILLMSFSCEKENNNDSEQNYICGSTNPEKDLDWLKEIVTQLENADRAAIIIYTYKGENVFSIYPCVQCPDAPTTIYNCEGEEICVFGGIFGFNTCPDFDSLANLDRIILKNY